MNLDDLRAELDAHARDIDTYATGRMPGIRAKIAQRRRRKAGATVAASVLAVGAIIGVPVVNQLSAGPEPAQQAPFPEKIDGDTLIASEMGDEGDTKVTLEFTPEDTDFLLKLDCDALAPRGDGIAARDRAPALHVRVNKQLVATPCGQYQEAGASTGLVGGAASRDSVRDFWSQGSVRPGAPVTITMRVTQGPKERPRTKPIDGRIGVSAYDMTGDRVESGGAALTKKKTIGGETYELGGYDVADGSETTASIDVPALDTPAYVTHGATRGFLGSGGRMTVDGRRGAFNDSHAILTEEMPDAKEHTLKVRDSAGTALNSAVVVAYYTRVDDSDDETDAFPATIDGDTKIASTMGDEGDTEVTLTFTPDDTNFLLDIECDALAPEAGNKSQWQGAQLAEVTINGRSVANTCGVRGFGPAHATRVGIGSVATAGWVQEYWREFGLKPDEPVTIKMQVADPPDFKPADGPIEGRIGLAAYEMSSKRVERSGVALTRERTIDGVTYELGGYDVASRGDTSASVDVPELDEPAFVVHGMTGGADVETKAWNPITVDGKRDVLTTGLSFGYVEALPDSDAHTVEVTKGLPQASTNVVVAYYTRADDISDATSTFPATLGGDQLIDATDINDKKWAVLRISPHDLKFQWALECNATVSVDVEIKGHIMSWTQRCRPNSLGERTMRGQVGGAASPAYLAGKRGRFLDSNDLVTIRARVNEVEKEPSDGEAVEVALGAYDMSGSRTVEGDIGLPKTREVDGQQYRLADYVAEETSDEEQTLSLDIPEAQEAPGLIVHGIPGIGWSPYRIEASPGLGLRGTTGSGFRTERLAKQPESTVTMTMRPYDDPSCTGVLAYYVPEE